MKKNVTETWFGKNFSELHPKIQKLHSHGGTLTGEVNVEYGEGLGKMLGKRLGKKLGLPQSAGPTSLHIEISHTDTSMVWSRKFGGSNKLMTSCFTPQGSYTNGYWIERTGNIEIHLGVVVQNGAWHWIQRSTIVRNVNVPAAFIPTVKAKKYIQDGLYHFEVELVKQGLGLLVRYSGALEAKTQLGFL